VLDMNAVGRWLLLNLVILPTRPAKSAEAYRQIWSERGSPLLYHGLDVAELVRERLGPTWKVELAMRYGKPTIEAALQAFRDAGVDRIVVFPLFPHYASSSTGSALEAVHTAASALWNVPQLSVVGAFYDDPSFVDAFAAVGRRTLAEANADHVIMSFHGRPERQCIKSDDTGAHCLKSATCCDEIVVANRNCYRAQCYATARALAAALELGADDYTVTFQSRLGKTPWIRPFTDVVLDELAAKGKKRLAVFCPSFIADCLETLEEIGMRARDQFRAAGGEEVTLVPSLNSEPAWADAIVSLIRASAERSAPPERP
jgi:ferrochelatase